MIWQFDAYDDVTLRTCKVTSFTLRVRRSPMAEADIPPSWIEQSCYNLKTVRYTRKE